MERTEMGRWGEKRARDYLEERGYRILAANYRAGRLGEIDLIACQKGCIFCIEVKTRSGDSYGTPAEAVSYHKQRTIRQVAACYLKAHGATEMPVQFDVIEVRAAKDGRLLDIQHIQQAF